jgi:hypothetical protein
MLPPPNPEVATLKKPESSLLNPAVELAAVDVYGISSPESDDCLL